MTDGRVSEFQLLLRATKWFDLNWYVYLKSVYTDLHSKTLKASITKVAQLIKADYKVKNYLRFIKQKSSTLQLHGYK